MNKGKILVIRGGAIGDFILTLPAVAALKRQFPDTHVEVLGYPHIAQLAKAGGLVERVQAIEARPLANFFARNGELAEEWCDYFSEFNIVVSYLYDPDEIFQTNVRRCTSAQFIVGPHRPSDADGIHATKVFLKPLERLAIFDADTVPRLALDSRLTALGPTLALHPGSSSERRNWPEEKWAELLAVLVTETKLSFLIVGGEVEGERLTRLAASLPPERYQIARSLPLPELAVQLQSCTTYIGHDTGITHLAAALGLPCLVLWGPTNEQVWRPQGDHVSILRNGDGLHGLSAKAVAERLSEILPAS